MNHDTGIVHMHECRYYWFSNLPWPRYAGDRGRACEYCLPEGMPRIGTTPCPECAHPGSWTTSSATGCVDCPWSRSRRRTRRR